MLQLIQIPFSVNSLNAIKLAWIQSNVTPAHHDGYAKAAMMYHLSS